MVRSSPVKWDGVSLLITSNKNLVNPVGIHAIVVLLGVTNCGRVEPHIIKGTVAYWVIPLSDSYGAFLFY